MYYAPLLGHCSIFLTSVFCTCIEFLSLISIVLIFPVLSYYTWVLTGIMELLHLIFDIHFIELLSLIVNISIRYHDYWVTALEFTGILCILIELSPVISKFILYVPVLSYCPWFRPAYYFAFLGYCHWIKQATNLP